MKKMKKAYAVILTVVFLVLMVIMVSAETLTQRCDVSEGGDAVFSTYFQGLPGGTEIWVLGENSSMPTYRIGMIRPISSHLRAGGYFIEKPEADQRWLNPRLIYCGDFLGAKGVMVIDGNLGLNDKSVDSLTLSDAYVTWSFGRKFQVGPDMNGSWVENKKAWVKGAVLLKAQISDSVGFYARWNCLGGGAPDSLRTEISWKF